MGANPDILVHAPKLVQLVFGGSGIVPAAICGNPVEYCTSKRERRAVKYLAAVESVFWG